MHFIEKAQAAVNLDTNYIFNSVVTKQGNANSLTTIVNKVVDTLLYVGGALAIIYIIYSGILYITAAGNPDNAKKGQQGIMNGVIGIFVIVLSYFIARAVANYAGNLPTTPSPAP